MASTKLLTTNPLLMKILVHRYGIWQKNQDLLSSKDITMLQSYLEKFFINMFSQFKNNQSLKAVENNVTLQQGLQFYQKCRPTPTPLCCSCCFLRSLISGPNTKLLNKAECYQMRSKIRPIQLTFHSKHHICP